MKDMYQPSYGFFEKRGAVIWTVLLVAVAARALFAYLFYGTFYWASLWSDSAAYSQWASEIVQMGDWLGREPFIMSPLYAYFLAVLYKLLSIDLLAVHVAQSLAGVATAYFVFLIGERLFSRRAGFFAGLIAAVYGPFLLSNNLILAETLKMFFLTLTFLLLLLAKERGTFPWWLASGISLGLAILCRPTDFLVLPFVIVWVLFFLRWPMEERLYGLSVFAVGLILIVLPVSIRNYTMSDGFISITSNGGLNFYLGNNPNAVGVFYDVERLDLVNDPDGREYAETVLGKKLRPSEVSSFWLDKAWDFVANQTGDFLRLLGRKALLFFHYTEIGHLGYNYHFIKETSVPWLGFMPTFLIVGPLGILGLVLAAGRWKQVFLLYGFFVAEFLSVILFFVTDRYRLSAMPFVIVFAGFAIVAVYDWLRKGEKTKVILAGIVLVIAVLMTTVFNYEVVEEFSMEYEYVGMMHFDAGQYERALQAFTAAQRYRDSYRLHDHIGNVHLAVGNVDLALAEYEVAHRMSPKQANSLSNIGRTYLRMQNWQSALNALNKSLEIDSRFAPAYRSRGLTLQAMGRYAEALEDLQRYTRLEKDSTKLATVWKDIENLKGLIQQQKKK